jgi:glycosyltransferase involved in cell wall biosynthesis
VRSGPYGWYHALYTRFNTRWERRAFDRAAILVAVSKRVRDELVGLGIASSRVRVIENGVDLDEFRPGGAERSVLGLPVEVPLAIFAGDIRSPVKNLGGVLEALVSVPGLHLAVAGSTTSSPYPARARELGLAERVHFLGFRRDMAPLLRAADFFVFPSRHDSCPLVVLEAMASGLPVVTARTVGNASLVEEAGGVVLDDPDDVEALSAALVGLVADPERRRRLGAAARTVAERHSWAAMADAYLNLFEEVAHRQSVPS